MHITELSIRRPVAVAMFFLGVILLGIVSLSRLSVDLLPDLSYPKLTVWTTYPGAAPEEVETMVTKPIEEAVGTVPGVRRIESVSREGVSLVTLEFLWGRDMDFAALNVREKLDRLRWVLPRETGRPTIIRIDPRSQPIMALSISGENLVSLKELARDVIKRRLEQLKGVALAQVTGGLEREIQVEVDKERLESLGLTIEQIASALAAANFNLPGGTIKKGRYRYSLRTLGEFQSIEEIKDVVVGRSQGGSIVRLQEVATMVDGFKERENITRFNGKESIGIVLKKEAGANTVRVSKRVRRVLKELEKEYPEIQIAVAYDQAKFISSAIANVLQAILFGGILAFLVLFFFLHDFRNPVNIALAIPISIIATFVLLYFSKVSLNMMSLGGLALGIGMLVDCSIVVLENIFRHRQEGRGRMEAALTGTKEVAMAVTASTLTTISVFLPIIYVKGVAGQLFKDQALTVTFSLLASLAVSLTLLPALASRFLYRGTEETSDGDLEEKSPPDRASEEKRTFWTQVTKVLNRVARSIALFLIDLVRFWVSSISGFMNRLFGPVFRSFDKFFQAFAQRYDRLLLWSLDHRPRVLGIVALALAISLLLGLHLKRELMPQVDQGEFTIRVELPPGTSLEGTAAVISEIEKDILQEKDVEAVFSSIGMTKEQAGFRLGEASINRAEIRVRLKDRAKKSTREVVRDLRARLQSLPEAIIAFDLGQTTLGQILGTAEADVAIKVIGEDLSISKNIIEEIKRRIEGVKGLKDLESSYEEGRPEIRITIDREAASRYGLSVHQVAQFVKNTMKGKVATQFKDFDRKIDILVRPKIEDRDELEDLLNSYIPLSHSFVPLRELITYTYTRGPTEIRRENQAREVVLWGRVEGRGLSDVIRDIEERIADVEHPYDYQISVGGAREEMRRSFKSLYYAAILAMALVYMILAAQFESLIHPFVIIFAVPLAAVGVIWGLFVTGQSFNVISLIGVVVLVGIAVNDAIVKVDFINQERRRGTPLREAIVEAGKKRLRPIIMTTVTTVFGLAPMAIGLGRGAELQRPLAIAVISGLLSATFLTLIVIPVIYSYLAGGSVKR